MAVVNPVPADKAAADVKPLYEQMTKRFGKMPNFFATMAHRPEVLKNFPAFYGAVTGDGAVDQKLKEFAYLKTSIVNGCQY